MSSILKKYAFNNIELRQKCRMLEIPVPNNGYFLKVRYGKKTIERRALGDFQGEDTVKLKLRERSSIEEKEKTKHTVLKKEIESDKSLKLKVPEKLINPDPLIISVKADLLKKKDDEWNRGFVRSSRGELAINVSNKNIERALRFMDSLIKTIKSRGHKISLKNGYPHIDIEGELIEVCCREKLVRVIVKGKYYDRTEYKSKELLSLKIVESYSNKEWVDGKLLLEEQLSNIIAFLELKVKKILEERIENRKLQAVQDAKRLIARQIQERKEKELLKFKELFKKVKRHDKAEMIRKYIAELERNAIRKNELSSEVIKEIEWARKKADWYDPFVEAYDEFLQGVNKESLSF
jgi:hypothetical protein